MTCADVSSTRSNQRAEPVDVPYTGVAHVSFSVPDLNRSKRWYAELFGWQEVMTEILT
jgi:catechol-2,3-dioxygenase